MQTTSGRTFFLPDRTRWFAGAGNRFGDDSTENVPMTQPDSLRDWFERVVRENERLFINVAYAVLRNPAAAEDAAQDGLLKAYSRLSALADPQAIVPWIAAIIRNCAIDIVRKQKAKAIDITEPGLEPPAAPQTGHYSDVRDLLLEEIGKLSHDQATGILLHYFEGLDIDQIAKRLHITPNTARVRLHRGRENLRRATRIRDLGEESES
jgi:RNA polymerase sigma-70 factor (ECF subfamily)